MTFRNFTPHAIVLNDGRVFESEGVARVANSFTEFDANGICTVTYGEPQGLPEPQESVMIIVSAMVLAACKDRNDLVAPATGHPACVRENGLIKSVPGFVR